MDQITGFRAVRFADTFLLDWYESVRVSRPERSSKEHIRSAEELSAGINDYESTKDVYYTAARNVRVKNKRELEEQKELEKDPRFDFYPGEAERNAKVVALLFNNVEVNDAWEKRVDAAIRLRECVNNALALGVIRNGDDLLQKLDKCYAANRTLTKMLSQARSKRIQPLKKDESNRRTTT